MNREEIQSKVIDLAAEQAGVDKSEITPATHFVNDLHFDSLDVVEFAMEIEDEFEVSISDDEVQKLQTIGDVIDHLAQRVADSATAG
jgi:acyl carrier protein